ncbi:MAG: hypothetical protein AB7I30_12560 [Isosphaeraceae bacterium]
MWPLALNLPLGLILGLVLAFTHKSMKSKTTVAKIAIGVVAGFGIFIVLNAVFELLGFAGVG